MSDSGKKTPSSPSKGLGTVPENAQNDDICASTGGPQNRSDSSDLESVLSKHLPGAVPGKQTMQSSASPELDGPRKRSLHAQLSRTFFQSRSASWSSSTDGCLSPSRHRLGTVAVEDPITHENVVNSKVLLLYTGGALGWKVDPQGKLYFEIKLIFYNIIPARVYPRKRDGVGGRGGGGGWGGLSYKIDRRNHWF